MDYEQEPIEDSGEIALEDLIAEHGAGEDSKVKFYKIVKEGGITKEFLLDEYAPDEFNFVEAARAHGGNGSYRIKIYGWNAAHTRKCAIVNRVEHYGGMVVTTPSAPTGGGDMMQIGTMIVEGFKTLSAQLAASKANPTIDPMEIRRQSMEEFRLLAETFKQPAAAAPAAAGPGIAEVLSLIRTGIEIGQGQVPGKDGESDFAANLLNTFGKPLAEIVSATAQAKARQQEQRQIPQFTQAQPEHIPGRATAGEEVPTIATTTEGAQEMRHLLYRPYTQYIQQLVAWAKENRDPMLYADLAIDQMQIEQIDTLLGDADLIDNMAKVVPAVGQYREWFTQFLQRMKDVRIQIDAPEEEAQPGSEHLHQG